MNATARIEAAFTATLAAALLALGATAFATFDRGSAGAQPIARATLPAVTVVGKRPVVEALAGTHAGGAGAQNVGSTARKAS